MALTFRLLRLSKHTDRPSSAKCITTWATMSKDPFGAQPRINCLDNLAAVCDPWALAESWRQCPHAQVLPQA